MANTNTNTNKDRSNLRNFIGTEPKKVVGEEGGAKIKQFSKNIQICKIEALFPSNSTYFLQIKPGVLLSSTGPFYA